jgi:hypothetical protein
MAGCWGFTVTEPGTYRVALSPPAWVGAVKDGQTIAAGSFGRGPECTTIRRIVEFPLSAGAHVLEIAAKAENTVNVLGMRKRRSESDFTPAVACRHCRTFFIDRFLSIQ